MASHLGFIVGPQTKEPPVSERPTSKDSIATGEPVSQPMDSAEHTRLLEVLTTEGLEEARAKVDQALARFNEATGNDIDTANRELTGAIDCLRAAYARAGRTLTAEQERRLSELSNLRSLFCPSGLDTAAKRG